MRKLYLVGLLYLSFVALVVQRSMTEGGPEGLQIAFHQGSDPLPAGDEGAWFRAMKPFCNVVEVETRLRSSPPPSSTEGQGFGAACLALAGKTAEARELLLALPEDERWRAAGIVFGVGHPVADAGDDRSAGPIMELVVEFWPNHYMALYHAGAARFALGEHDRAEPLLQDFLRYYEPDDGWTGNAQWMLTEIAR